MLSSTISWQRPQPHLHGCCVIFLGVRPGVPASGEDQPLAAVDELTSGVEVSGVAGGLGNRMQ